MGENCLLRDRGNINRGHGIKRFPVGQTADSLTWRVRSKESWNTFSDETPITAVSNESWYEANKNSATIAAGNKELNKADPEKVKPFLGLELILGGGSSSGLVVGQRNQALQNQNKAVDPTIPPEYQNQQNYSLNLSEETKERFQLYASNPTLGIALDATILLKTVSNYLNPNPPGYPSQSELTPQYNTGNNSGSPIVFTGTESIPPVVELPTHTGSAAGKVDPVIVVSNQKDEENNNASKKHTPEQQVVIEIAKEVKKQKGSVTTEEAEILVEWGKEAGLGKNARGPESHPTRGYGKQTHIHVGSVNHLPVED